VVTVPKGKITKEPVGQPQTNYLVDTVLLVTEHAHDLLFETPNDFQGETGRTNLLQCLLEDASRPAKERPELRVLSDALGARQESPNLRG
jgi:hypothetical protein